MLNNTVYEWILHSTFTVPARQRGLAAIEPVLSGLIRPGAEALDLCCGSGFVSFWLEAHGAKVTALDFAPYMIGLAQAEARRRNSSVEFVEADIFTQEFGAARFDLITCFGNSISDFPLLDFAKLAPKIAGALKPGGRFVLDYHDGSAGPVRGRNLATEGVYQESPERITFRFKEYLPEAGANVVTIRNEARGEEYERKSYVYTVPSVRLALSSALDREQHQVVGDNHFVDVFAARPR